jgi:flagellar hook assembly protein FlgD
MVTVHDLLGRRVATLLDEDLEFGEHGVVWNGCDDAGHTVASGTYVIRLQKGEESRSVKAMLAR